MKKLILLILMNLTASSAFASSNFYECSGFADVEEYRAGIDLKKNKASFFDNDATTVMTLKATKFFESMPPQTMMIFEGKDASHNGKLRLDFNVTKKEATMYSIGSDGNVSEIGSASCSLGKPWDL